MNDYEIGIDLWNQWTSMWNGRPELALTLVADRFALHLPTPSALDQTAVVSPADVERWVTRHRASYRTLRFETGCGPFVDTTRGIISGPWFADASPDGKPRQVCGIDVIAFRSGKISEYWTLSKEVDAVARWVTRLLE
jgi:hypothetical protein